MDEIIRNIAVFALPVLFAITLHEAAHAYAAKRFGDLTAYAAGRMTLNPLVHIDLFGTIIIPIALYVTTGFVFGYAKPVPVDFGRLRNPKRDMAWVALAGPGANFIMALMWLVFGLLLVAEFFRRTEPHSPVAYLADKAASWGEQPLHVWLKTVVKDAGALAHVDELLGIERDAGRGG